MLSSFMLVLGLMTVGFGFYIMGGGQSLFVMGIILFVSSLFFALQPMAHALVADITLSAYLGAMLGMMNLIGEIGAVLSPAISGVLRGATGSWTTAVMLDGAIVLAGFVLIVFVRETRAPAAETRPSEEVAAPGSEPSS
jgi:ACS family D-galactonate transporter-like MFS transporter